MQRVELLGNRSPASHHFQIQLAQVLVQSNRFLRPHVGRFPWPRNLPERQEPPGVLLLYPGIQLELTRGLGNDRLGLGICPYQVPANCDRPTGQGLARCPTSRPIGVGVHVQDVNKALPIILPDKSRPPL